MDNGLESMLDVYLYETTSLMDQLEELLMDAEKVGDFSSDDVNEIFRIMHTIKGSSAMMEFTSLSTIAHRIEDLFYYIRDKGIDSLDPNRKKELFDLMFRSADLLRGEVTKVESGEPLSSNVDSFTQEINDFLAKIKDGGNAASSGSSASNKEETPAALAEASPELLLPADPEAVCFIHIHLEEGLGMENLRAFMIVNSLKDSEAEFNYYPADMDTNPDTCQTIVDEGFYLAFASMEEGAKVEGLLPALNHIRSYELIQVPGAAPKEEPAALASEPVPAAEEASAPAPAPMQPKADAKPAASSQPSSAHAPVKQSLISVNLAKLDSLINIVGELVITESMVTSSSELQYLPRDSYDNFMMSGRQLRKLTNDLQDIAMSLRMVPVSGVFQKMNRVVRDMNQKLSKNVRLTIIGEHTEIDKTIVDSIQDPLMHMVRNSMDHGIEETSEERIAAGKDPNGEIILSASHTNSEVIISVADDGYGMDTTKLLAKAKQKGLLVKPENEYSHKEALNLILLPGFSTNQAVTEFSGRGVGMDVVKKNVEAVGGTVSISSELGVGTTMTMMIPLTLAIVVGMKVTVGASIFTIPISNIRQSFKATPEQIILDEYGNEMIDRMGNIYPIIRLHRFYNLDTEIVSIEDGILLWVEASDRSYCLFVDELIDEQQVVVKPLPAFLNTYELKNSGISGCTILGDGTISIILDILNLYTAAIETI